MTSKSDETVYNEICDKLQIARHVLPRIVRPPPEFENNCFVRTMCYYTGIDNKTVDDLVRHRKARKTFFDLLRMKNNKNEASVISFEQMRNILIDQYVIYQQIPTKDSIVKAIRTIDKSNRGYYYTPSILKQDLNNLGFIWKRLPKSDRYIVVENTEQFSNRMKYFQQMKEYRESNRVLIHVERTISSFYYTAEHRAHTTEIIVVASPQLGLIDTCFPPKLKPFDFFLRNKLHTVPHNSVFVIEQSNPSGVDLERTCTLPTIHSQKKDMIKWLEAYDIPCDSTLYRGDLFALIEKHKVNCPPYYRCCEILKAAGHDVILRPPELTYTKYFKRILKGISDNNSMTFSVFKKHVLNIMNYVPQEYWLEEDQIMAAAEQRIYDEEQKLELILDKLMEGIKNKSLSVADFKECEDEELDNDFVENVIFGAYPLRPGQVKPRSSKSSKPGPSGSPKPGPSGSSMPGPSGSFKPRQSGSYKPGPSSSSKPEPSGSPKPGTSGSSIPGPSGSSMPGPSGSFKPRPSGSYKPGPSSSSKSGPSRSPKPGPSGLSMPGPSGSYKPGPSSSSKPGPLGLHKPGQQAHLSQGRRKLNQGHLAD